MPIRATFEADFSSFQSAVQKAEVSLKSFETGAAKVGVSLNRMANSFSGKKVIQDATLMAKAIAEAGGASKLTESELRRVAAATGEATAKMKALGIQAPADLKRLANEASLAAKALQPLGDRLQNAGMQMTSAGMAITKFTAPLTVAAGLSLKAAIDFESGFAGVRKTVNATEPELQALSAGFRKLATELPISAVELTKVGEAAGQLGIKKEHILSFTETMAKLGATTNLTADEAATAMARFTNIMGTPQEAVGKLGAALVALGNNGASTEKEIVDMALRIAGAGKTIGFTEGQVLGLANALSSVGIEAEMGGSAISRVMINAAKAVNDGGDALTEFAKVAKMSNAEFVKLFNQDSGAAMSAFISGLSKIKAEGGNLLNTLEALGFSEIRVRDTLLRVANAGDLVTESMKLGNQSMKDGTALNEEFAKRVNTTAAQLQIMWNRITDVGIELGNALMPALKSAADAVQGLIPYLKAAVQVFVDLPGPVKTGAIALGALVVAIGPALYILGQLTISVGALSTAFVALSGSSGVMTAVSAIRSIGAAAAVSNTLLLGLGAGLAGLAVGGALVLVARQFDQLQKDLSAAANRSGGPIGKLEKGLLTLDDAQVKAALSAGKLSHEWNATIGPLGKAATVTGSAATGTNVFTEALKKARIEIAALAPAVRRDLVEAIRSGVFSMDQLKDKSGLSEIALKLLSTQVKESAKAAVDATKKYEAWLVMLREHNHELTKWQGTILATIPALGTFNERIDLQADLLETTRGAVEWNVIAMDSLGKVTQTAGGALQGLNGMTKTFSEDIQEAAVKTSQFSDGLKDAFSKIPGILKAAFTGGGGIVGAMKAFGVQMAEALMAPFLERLSIQTAKAAGILTGALKIGVPATASAGVSAAASGAGTAVGGAAAGGGVATGAAPGGIALGTGLATAGIGAAAIGVYVGIKKLMAQRKEMAVNATRDQWFSQMGHDLETLNPRILKATGSLKLMQILFKAKTEQQYAEAVGAINEALAIYDEQLRLASEAHQGLVARMSELVTLSPELTTALQGAYDSQTPEDYLTAIGEINRVLDEQASTQDFLNQTLEKYGLTWKDLGEEARKAHVSVEAGNIEKEFRALQSAGVDVNNIMRHMGDSISDFVLEAVKTGTEVPEGFRDVIQTAIDAGEVFTVSTAELEKLREEAKKLGKPFDEAAFKVDDLKEAGVIFGTTMEEATRDVQTAIQDLTDVIKNILGPAIRNIPDGDFTVKGHVDLPKDFPKNYELDIPAMEMASGGRGRVTKPTLFLAGEAGSEDFAFSGANKRFAGASATGPPMVIQLYQDGRQTAEAIVPYLPGAVQRIVGR